MCLWPRHCACTVTTVRYIDAKPTESLMPHIQSDAQKMTAAHRCANTKTRRAAIPSHSTISDPIVATLLIESPATEARRWATALPTAGSFPEPLSLIHGDPSALISHQQDSPDKQVYTCACGRLIKGIRQSETWSEENELIRFPSIPCVLWISECGCVCVPNPGHKLHSVRIIKLPQFWQLLHELRPELEGNRQRQVCVLQM